MTARDFFIVWFGGWFFVAFWAAAITQHVFAFAAVMILCSLCNVLGMMIGIATGWYPWKETP